MSYEKQVWSNGTAGGTPLNADRLNHMEAGIEAPTKQPAYVPREEMSGPVHSEVPVFSGGIAADASFNETYIVTGNALPEVWPVDCWGDASIINNFWVPKTSLTSAVSVATYRVMCDGSEICWASYGGFEGDVYIDGQPYVNNPILNASSAGIQPYGYQKLVFPSARPRLIEIVTLSGLIGIYTKKPYRLWKPTPDPNPKVAVVGDSYVLPYTLSDTTAAMAAPDPYLTGAYQRIAALLGITSLTTDGIGGTGYLAGGAQNRPYTHQDRKAWLLRLNPDVIVVHGGGANDISQGHTIDDIINAASNHFRALRQNHPHAKLVFVEGISTPYLSADVNYRLIREGVQSNLEEAGVTAYYLDIATTRPPFKGTGYVTAPSGNENSNIYIGHDRAHYTVLGARYLRNVIAPKLRLVLADKGLKEGSLIL